jgi:hypothetical protein
MRIWSLHPKYLDAKGLVALWRESLLAKHVLEGKTKGYLHHPQLERFKNSKRPVDTINQYLTEIYHEALNRNYQFDKTKVNWRITKCKLPVTRGQLEYEVSHLLRKLEERDPLRFQQYAELKVFEIHPLFELIEGDVESWEIIRK